MYILTPTTTNMLTKNSKASIKNIQYQFMRFRSRVSFELTNNSLHWHKAGNVRSQSESL